MQLGDNFYDHGVDNVQSSRFHDTYESVFTADALQVPW